MPSLKMKTKSATGCLKEKCSLHICRKSNVISKSPLSHLRVSENLEDIISCNHDIQDDLAGDETNHIESSNEEKDIQKQLPNATESASEDIVEPPLCTCTSNTETILSPVLESMELGTSEGGTDNLYVPPLDCEDSGDSTSANERPVCNVPYFYISDFIFSEPIIGTYSIFDNGTDTTFERDYQYEHSNLLRGLSEEYMILPVSDDNLDVRHNGDTAPPSGTIVNADQSSFHMAIHQLKSCNQDSNISSCPDQNSECFDPQLYLPETLVPHEKQSTKRITLVLDLDETLVHSTLVPCDDADFTFTIFFGAKEYTVYVRQRPHLQAFLEKVAEMFEVVIFTASQSIYAKPLLDILDLDRKIIWRRAYRESCIFSDGTYMKDVTVLGVDLAKVAIIDNSPQVFRLQGNNGIPIKSWFDDPSDCALISLLPFLETLVNADDVRPIIASKFGNKE